MLGHKNQSGFSLIEVVIATAILAIIVTTIFTSISGTETQDTFRGNVQTGSACLIEAQKVLSNIKEKSHDRHRINFPIAKLSVPNYLFAAGEVDTMGKSVDEFGIAHLHRWPIARPIYVVAPDANILRPNLLIMGYMNALQAMYNSDPVNFCDNATQLGRINYFDGTIITAPTSSILPSVVAPAIPPTSHLRIQIFNTNTGAVSCPAAVDIRPVGANEAALTANRQRPPGLTATNHPSSANEEVFDPAPGVVNDLGFIVTATIRYRDRLNNIRNCRVQEKFQYTAQAENTLTMEFEDIELPIVDGNIPENLNTRIRSNVGATPTSPPSYSFSDSNYSARPIAERPIYLGCAETDTRDVNIRLTRTRSGSIHMCRNLSAARATIQAPAANWDYSTVAAQIGTNNGFALRMGQEQRNTFYSTELMQNDYFASKDALDAVSGDLFAAGLFYPSGTYYCLDISNCGGAANTTTAQIVEAALPRFPRGSFAPGGVAGTDYYTSTGVRYYQPSNHNANIDVAANWIPCEQAQVCGVTPNPASTGFVAGNTANAPVTDDLDAYHLTFSNVPSGCEIHLQIAEVDAGYNVKAMEFKDYIPEKAPGNWLCRNETLANGTFDTYDGYGTGVWFFACRTVAGTPDAAPTCTAASPGDCCTPYPFFPEYKSYHDP